MLTADTIDVAAIDDFLHTVVPCGDHPTAHRCALVLDAVETVQRHVARGHVARILNDHTKETP